MVDDIPTGITTASLTPGSFAITPNGQFAFINELDNSGTSNFVVMNLVTRTITKTPSSTLGFVFFEPTMELSSDGRLIVLGGDDGTLRIFDVGTNPNSPALVATLHGTSPAGLPAVFLGFPRIVGNRLFSFDINNNIVNVFNFLPATGDFTELANIAIPGAMVTKIAVGLAPTLMWLCDPEPQLLACLMTAGALPGCRFLARLSEGMKKRWATRKKSPQERNGEILSNKAGQQNDAGLIAQ